MDTELKSALFDVKRYIYYIIRYIECECNYVIDSVVDKEMVIYYTASTILERKFIDYWIDVDKHDDNFKYYSYNRCMKMLRKKFNSKVARKFQDAASGLEKVMLFKMAMMYMNPGLVIDPNIKPDISPDILKNDRISSYIVVSEEKSNVNMMMMANASNLRSVLFLTLLLAYFVSDEDNFDIYSTLAYNVGTFRLKSDETYRLRDIKYKVFVGNSDAKQKYVDLIWFPQDEVFQIKPCAIADESRFTFCILGSRLYVTSRNCRPWKEELVVDIIFSTNETLYTLSETDDGNTCRIKKNDMTLCHCDYG